MATMATILVQRLGDALNTISVAGTASVGFATATARLARVVARMFSVKDGVSASATEDLARVVETALTGAASARCAVAAPATEASGVATWFSPAVLAANIVTPPVLQRMAAVDASRVAAPVFAALMTATTRAGAGSGAPQASALAAAARSVLSSIDLRLCDIAAYVEAHGLASERKQRGANAPGSVLPEWVVRTVTLLEVMSANLTQGRNLSPSLGAAVGARASHKRVRAPGSSPLPASSGEGTDDSDASHGVTAQLVQPLVQVLAAFLKSKHNGATDAATAEYVCLMVFTALTSAVEALVGRVPVNDAAAARVVDVDLVLQSIEECESLQSRSAGLLLVAQLAALLPTAVVQHLMPMLACLGRSSLHRDDSYSFYVVQQIIEAVIPALHEHGAPVGLSGFSLVGQFVGMVDKIPSHRRTALFHSVVVSLGATLDSSDTASAAYLFAVSILLLLAAPEHAGVCHSLFNRFSAGQQASNLAQMLNVCRHAMIADEANAVHVLKDMDSGSGSDSEGSWDGAAANGDGAASDASDGDDSASEGAGDGDDNDDVAMDGSDAEAETDGAAPVALDKNAVKAMVANGMGVKALLAQLSVAAQEDAAEAESRRQKQMVDGGAAAIAAVVAPAGVDPMLMLTAVASFVDEHLSDAAFLGATASASAKEAGYVLVAWLETLRVSLACTCVWCGLVPRCHCLLCAAFSHVRRVMCATSCVLCPAAPLACSVRTSCWLSSCSSSCTAARAVTSSPPARRRPTPLRDSYSACWTSSASSCPCPRCWWWSRSYCTTRTRWLVATPCGSSTATSRRARRP